MRDSRAPGSQRFGAQPQRERDWPGRLLIAMPLAAVPARPCDLAQCPCPLAIGNQSRIQWPWDGFSLILIYHGRNTMPNHWLILVDKMKRTGRWSHNTCLRLIYPSICFLSFQTNIWITTSDQNYKILTELWSNHQLWVYKCRPRSLPMQIQNIFSSTYHIKYLDACIKY
jgi:hypothetical protein